MKYSTGFLMQFANTVLHQIVAGVGQFVVMSWGVRGHGIGTVSKDDGTQMPCVILKVSGLIHTGLVVIALNEGADTYEVQLRDNDGNVVGDWRTDVYCDELGALIDSLIERPDGMSDDDYERESSRDSYLKMLEDEAVEVQ